MSAKELYTIGEISQICNISAKTLRFYDSTDLVKPQIKNPSTLYRYYTKEQMFTIFLIKKLQLLGFSLKEIKSLLESNNPDIYVSELSVKLEEINKKITSLQKIYSEGLFFIDKLKIKKEHKDYLEIENAHLESVQENISHGYQKEVQLETIKKRDVLYTIARMHEYNNIDISINRWFEIYKMAEERKLTVTGSIFLTYHTDNPMEQFFKSSCDLEVMLPVEGRQDCNDIKEFGGFTAAVAVHVGSYESISVTHLRLLKWVDENGFVLADKVTEEYLISPIDLKTDCGYITRIIAPVVPKND